MTQGLPEVYRFKSGIRKILVENLGEEKVNQLENSWHGNEARIMKIIEPHIKEYDEKGWVGEIFGPVS